MGVGSIRIMAGRDWLGEQLGVSGQRAHEILARLEGLGWLRRVPLPELEKKYRSLYDRVKILQAENGGRATTVVELRSDPERKTLWMKKTAA
jgi:hypothetical protein